MSKRQRISKRGGKQSSPGKALPEGENLKRAIWEYAAVVALSIIVGLIWYEGYIHTDFSQRPFLKTNPEKREVPPE